MTTTETITKTCTWIGASGNEYTYHVHDLPTSFNKDQYGNYIYTRLNNEDRWIPIYIGDGDLDDRVSDNHHKAKCIKSKGATHVHVHLTANKKAGQAEEADLLARFTNAFMPHGCNEAPSG